jgi:hypothetical protein
MSFESWDLRWIAAMVGALLVAGVFAVFVPNAEKVNAAEGVQFFIARWGHSLVWMLLAVSFLMRATQNETLVGLANPVSAAGGLMYLAFLVTFTRL